MSSFGRWSTMIGGLWALGLAIRLWDVAVYRPTCIPSEASALDVSCYQLGGDAAGFFGAAQLVKVGEIGMNPLLYDVTGGRLVSTAAKPPIGVGWLSFLAWMGDSPWLGQTVVAAILIAVTYLLVKRTWGRARGLLVAEIGIALFVALRIVDGSDLTTVRVMSVLMSSASIPLMAMVGRRAAPAGWGIYVGAVTALIVAVNPAIWVGDSMLNNETELVVVLPLFLLACYRVLDQPEWPSWLLLGVAMAALILTRVELAGLVVIVTPFLVYRSRPDWAARLRSAAVFGTALIVLLGVYSGWNRLRLGAGSPGPTSVFGIVLNAGSCDTAFHGDMRGLWFPCWAEHQRTTPQSTETRVADVVDRLADHPGYADQLTDPDVGILNLTMNEPPLDLFDGFANRADIRSALQKNYGQLPDGSPGVGIWVNDRPVVDPDFPVTPQDDVTFMIHPYFIMTDEPLAAATLTPPTFEYLSEHRAELPGVMAARLGRITGLYRTSQTMNADGLLEAHAFIPSRFGFAFLWVLSPFALLGVVVLARARRPLAPLVGPIVNVTLVAMAIFGLTRYRLSADLAIAALAAVGLVAVARRLGRRPETVTAIDE